MASARALTLNPRSPRYLIGLLLSMHAVLIPFLDTAVASARDLGPTVVGDVDLPGTMSTAAATANTRSLLHGNLKPWQYPTCPRCKLIRCANGWWTGHCKKSGSVFTCRRSKSSVARLAAPVNQDVVLEVPEEDVGGDLGSVIIDGEAAAPYVPCASDGECALPVKEFAKVNGTKPIASKGKLKARCLFPEASAARTFGSRTGVCLCSYRVRAKSLESTKTPDGGKTKKGKKKKPRKKRRVLVDDFCERKARTVIGPKARNKSRYKHAPHAEIGPLDVVAPSKERRGKPDDGPDLAGVTVSSATVGAELEVYDPQ